jgi:2-hydroxychromene-2-carboxylate isomerase
MRGNASHRPGCGAISRPLAYRRLVIRAFSARARLESVIEGNQVDHDRAGHWGVPTCAFRGEPFFGQDRLDVLLWRLKKEGLQTR